MWRGFSLFILASGWIQVALTVSELEIKSFVQDAETKLEIESIKATHASWNFESNITDETQALSLDAQDAYDALFKKIGKDAQRYSKENIQDPDVKRKLKLLSNLGTAVLRPDILRKFNKLKAEMGKKYSTAKVKDYESMLLDYSLEPELTQTMAESRDPAELEYYWTQWRDQSGKQIKDMYKEYVEHYNNAAVLNGFKEMENTWQGLKPLYEELHAYVRNKLNKHYGDSVLKNSGPIPAHLLGNMWAQ
ncbi:angiotensin-converting enzyme isoform X2 [Eurytemora carolleeae]|nr:angiotensin-converting enzyme isoform X2 [Eurytemora carolleeae]|eukprot:XP_023319903.1 angiotensin-converting enzyme-like isoform X2 [Eurytemora affinis]